MKKMEWEKPVVVGLVSGAQSEGGVVSAPTEGVVSAYSTSTTPPAPAS